LNSFGKNLCRWLLSKIQRSNGKNVSPRVISNDFIGAEIMSYGGYETKELDALLEALDFNSQNYTAIDVGANIGNHTLHFARSFQEVLAFEPHPISFKILEINTLDLPNVKIFPFGLSNKSSSTTLFYDKHNLGKANFNQGEKEIPVSVEIGDSTVKSDVALIKIDVEGHELEVLQGFYETIKTSLPVISFEFNPNSPNHLEVISFLNKMGYEDFFSYFQKSIFQRTAKRRFFQKVVDDLLYKPTNSLISFDTSTQVFQNMIFSQAKNSIYRFKSESIIN